MKNLKKLFTAGGTTLFIIGYYALLLIGVGIHLWTILLAYSNSGFVLALCSLAIPVISEIYWMVSFWFILGFFNSYTFAIISYSILIAVAYMLAYYFSNKVDN